MTRRLVLSAFAAALLLSGAAFGAQTPAPAAKPVDITGKWTMVLELSIGTSNPALDLKQEGDKISGTYTGRYGASKLTGKLDADRKLSFTVALEAEGTAVTMVFSGDVSADGQTMSKGVVQIEGLGEGNWAGKKDKS